MKFIGLTFLFFFTLITGTYAQKINNSEKDIYEANEIVFYGYDYTHFKLADEKRVNQDLKKFVPVWDKICLKHITEKRLAVWLDKERTTFNFEPTLELNNKILSIDIAAVSKHTISKELIQSYVDAYKIPEKKGVGFVVILECFDNSSKRVSGYYTFFDIATKRVLKSDYHSSRDGNSYNRVADWGGALIMAFKRYVTVYKDNGKLYAK